MIWNKVHRNSFLKLCLSNDIQFALVYWNKKKSPDLSTQGQVPVVGSKSLCAYQHIMLISSSSRLLRWLFNHTGTCGQDPMLLPLFFLFFLRYKQVPCDSGIFICKQQNSSTWELPTPVNPVRLNHLYFKIIIILTLWDLFKSMPV